MEIKNYKLYLKIKSPVHIGCDDVFDLTDFYLAPSEDAIILYDKRTFIDRLKKDDKLKEFYKKIDSNKLAEIAKFINDNAKGINGKKIRCSKTIAEKYKECIRGGNFNKFEIKRTIYLAHSLKPYIPGSSLKGAIRTAVIDSLIRQNTNFSLDVYAKKDKNGQIKEYDFSEMEKYYLGNFSENPFSLIKISDLVPKGEVETQIKIAKNFKKNNDQFTKLYSFVEVITKGEFEGDLSIINIKNRKIKIETILSIEKILNSCKEFWKDLNEDLNKKNTINIRIGHFCGAENVTISKRQIRIKTGRYLKWEKEPTTKWRCTDDLDNRNIGEDFGICEINITPIN